MSATAWIAIAVFALAYVLIATEWVHRLAAAIGGACVMLVLGITDPDHAFFSPHSGIDWNVIFLLIGMMLIVAVLKRTGLFEFLAIWAVKRARGQPFRVMVILVLVTGLASAALDNVTTVLLIAPVTFLVCGRLGVPVAPYLIAEVMASNIGGTATLIGDPPNIIIASRAGLTFNDFLIHLAPFVVVVLVVFIGLCRVLFRSAFQVDAERAASVMELRERDAIRDARLLMVSLAVLGVVLLAFVTHTILHLEPSVVALVGGLALLALSRLDAAEVVRDVEWPTLAFFAALFVMVGGLSATGVIDTVAKAATDAMADRLGVATMVLLWGSAGLSAIVDNIPYVATMSPIVADLVSASDAGARGQVLWWALALGADLGGNATAIGASANVVMLGLAEKAGRPISFWEFTRYGLVVTAVTIALAVPYLWFRYLL
ncbi:SLC13 family permease [Actinopolymorpha pittospori]|uniref:Na+/H+ antiporter NhaD/arsenite permease-like protein n=1 Tax=Actinopolymorpha pittospori TaxID=648752 RepID=A0A927MVV8_9ACTN|nr:Na+/H+ antiporter NhaD/arsenite permease-like protein [Actinopolymorpha pittospori]